MSLSVWGTPADLSVKVRKTDVSLSIREKTTYLLCMIETRGIVCLSENHVSLGLGRKIIYLLISEGGPCTCISCSQSDNHVLVSLGLSGTITYLHPLVSLRQ